MRRFNRNNSYLTVRRWIDHDIAHRYRAPSVQISAVLTGVLVMFLLCADGWLLRLALAPFLLLSAICTGFIFWRLSRIMRATTILSARDYDHRGKFLLPPEYANSESSLAAARRKRRGSSQRRGMKPNGS